MDELNRQGVPVEVIAKGRDLEKVLSAYMRFFDEAKEVSVSLGKSGDDVFADEMKVAAYRIYLLGVEDGMKGAAK